MMKTLLSRPISEAIAHLEQYPQVQHAKVFGSLISNPSQAKDVDLFIPCHLLNIPFNAYKPLLEQFSYGQTLYKMLDVFIQTSKALGVRDELCQSFIPALPKTAKSILKAVEEHGVDWNDWRQTVELHPDVQSLVGLPSRIYFAHPMTSYGSVSELRSLKLMRTLFDHVVNPSERQYSQLCGNNMKEWEKLASQCDGIIFMAFEDGSIGSGVAMEVSKVFSQGKPCFQISPQNGAIHPISSWPGKANILSIDQTRSRVRSFIKNRERSGKRGLPVLKNTGNLDWLKPSSSKKGLSP